MPILTSYEVDDLEFTENFKFNSAISMAQGLSSLPEVQLCTVKQAFRYTFGRLEREQGYDDVILERAYNQYKKNLIGI